MIPTLRAILKLTLFALLTLVVIPPQLVVMLFTRGKAAYYIPHIWQQGTCAALGIKVRIKGKPYTDRQTLYVSNHMSYLDIPVLGSAIRASFVAKHEVADWPVFGFLSKLQQTAFISRSREEAMTGTNTLEFMLKDGKSLIFFPEGTSTDGQDVLPFKSTLFSIAFQNPSLNLVIQPITLKIELTDGHPPASQSDRDLYAWHINMDTPLHKHLWNFAKHKGTIISLHFHKEIEAQQHNNRKQLASTCHKIISNSLKNDHHVA